MASLATAFVIPSPSIGRRSGMHATATTTTTLFVAMTSHDTPTQLPDFADRSEYLSYMESVSALPQGFATGTADGTFVSVEAPGMGKLPIRGTVIYLTDAPTESWAAVFTKNQFPGAPVLVGKQRVKDGKPLHAIVVNNKVSNVCSGGDGVADAGLVCEAVAEALKLPGGGASVLPSSTGVIGWRLPAKELAEDVVPKAVANLQSVSALNAATAICTTDRYPKVRSKTLACNGARIVGIAKGAGMIEPNMATMLSYIMTDATIDRKNLQSMLKKAADQSFNSISVDGDESTSDTLVVLSSNKIDGTDESEFEQALMEVCRGLAADLVRNGEGTGHVMKVDISNFPGTDQEARRLGRHIVNSPLFKCAVSGNDPNTGRLAAAIGSFMGKFEEMFGRQGFDGTKVTLTLGGRNIFKNGKFVLEGQAVEEELSNHMQNAQYDEHSDYPPHQKFVEIGVNFGSGTGSGTAIVYGSDLTAEYVSINGDYRS
jgi:glutamate N-acetyltransferase/amino-acid N-acetyltransferase